MNLFLIKNKNRFKNMNMCKTSMIEMSRRAAWRSEVEIMSTEAARWQSHTHVQAVNYEKIFIRNKFKILFKSFSRVINN